MGCGGIRLLADALRREVTNPVNNCMAISDILVSEGCCPPVGACAGVGGGRGGRAGEFGVRAGVEGRTDESGRGSQ